MEHSEDFLYLQVIKGKRLARLLMILNIVLVIVLSSISIIVREFSVINFIDTLITIFICLFIYGGSKVAKWIYIVFSGISILRVFSLFGSIFQSDSINELTFGIWILLFLPLLINIITTLLLIFSESINEFLYKQAN